jgi:hypothetical protein
VVAWIWLGQFLAADGNDGPFYDCKRQVARCFFIAEPPRTDCQFALLERPDRTAPDADPAWF